MSESLEVLDEDEIHNELNNPLSRFDLQIKHFFARLDFKITIRCRWSKTDYPIRMEFSINFRDCCMLSKPDENQINLRLEIEIDV